MSGKERFQPTEENTAAALQRVAELETRLAAPVYQEAGGGELGSRYQPADLYVGESSRNTFVNDQDYRTEARFGLERHEEGQVKIVFPGESSGRTGEASITRSKKSADGSDKRAIHVRVSGNRVHATATTENDVVVGQIRGNNPEDLATIRREAAKSVRLARQVRHRKQDWIKERKQEFKQQDRDRFRDIAENM